MCRGVRLLLAASGGVSFRGGLVHLLKSQVRGGGVLLTNGRHKRYIPLSGLSVLLAP